MSCLRLGQSSALLDVATINGKTKRLGNPDPETFCMQFPTEQCHAINDMLAFTTPSLVDVETFGQKLLINSACTLGCLISHWARAENSKAVAVATWLTQTVHVSC